MTTNLKISFLGFGEAAQAFSTGLLQSNSGIEARAYDIKTQGTDADKMWAKYDEVNLVGTKTCIEACTASDIIFSTVTADQAEAAAQQASAAELNNAFYLDCNSCSPEAKKRSAKVIEAAGGRYVDVAVMTPVHPRLHKSPCYLAGEAAKTIHEIMTSLGMDTKIVGEEIGAASTRKMVRSVMIKGLEALTIECFLAARQAGIEDEIAASLEASFPGFNWQQRAPYMIERAMTHGIRRAAEMQEVSQTLRDLGVTPHSTDATVLRQREVGALQLNAAKLGADDLGALTDAIHSTLQTKTI